jgi:tight adherence protein C
VRAHRAARRRTARHFPDAVDLFVVAVRAGFLPAEAMQRIRQMVPTSLTGPVDAVCRQLAAGSTFSDAVDTLRVSVGPAAYAFVDALAAADRYGLPLAPVLDRLAGEARDQRRRDGEASARELPVRLAAPLVLCTLPSFALLAIAPLLLGALSSLQL